MAEPYNRRRRNSPVIRTNPEFQELFSRYPETEMNELMKSMETYGQLHPIFVNKKREILDGHNRFEACKRLGLAPKYEVKHFRSKEDEIIFILECNLQKRNLNEFQRIEKLVLYREPIEATRAVKRKKSGLLRGDRTPLAQIHTYGESGKVAQLLAPLADVGETTYYHAKRILQEGTEAIKQNLRDSKITIDAAYKKLRAKVITDRRLHSECKVFQVGDKATIIEGRITEIDRKTLSPNSIDLIFPTADCSDSTLAGKISRFASIHLRRGGHLVVYVKHGAVGKIASIITKNAKKFDLVHVMSVAFDTKWLNIEGEPIVETNTAIFLVYSKRPREKDLEGYFAPYFEGPILVDGEPAGDNEDKLVRPREANFYVADYLMKTLHLDEKSVVCDPNSNFSEVAKQVLAYGCNVICVEEDAEKCKSVREEIERWIVEKGEVVESESEITPAAV